MYESYFRELFKSSVRPDMTVIDGGAHIGLYSLLACRLLGHTGRVLAFEPDPFNFPVLTYNVTRTGCQNVMPLQKALSNRLGVSTFWSSSGTIGSSLSPRSGIGPTKPISVPITTLNADLSSHVRSILVKLDIEGHEPFALQGMEGILSEVKSAVIMVEINPSALGDSGMCATNVVSILRRLGFSINVVDERQKKVLPLVDDHSLVKCNLYCVLER